MMNLENDFNIKGNEVEASKGENRRKFLKKIGAYLAGTALLGIGCENSEKVRDKVSYEFESFDGGEAHKSGNEFANRVGLALQENIKNGYHTKIVRPTVNLFVKEGSGKCKFKFIWSCDIVPCQQNEVDTHFDRRGTLLFANTLQEARDKVEAELAHSQKVNSMMNDFDRVYGKHKMPFSFVSESSAKVASGGSWYVKEFFCTA